MNQAHIDDEVRLPMKSTPVTARTVGFALATLAVLTLALTGATRVRDVERRVDVATSIAHDAQITAVQAAESGERNRQAGEEAWTQIRANQEQAAQNDVNMANRLNRVERTTRALGRSVRSVQHDLRALTPMPVIGDPEVRVGDPTIRRGASTPAS